LPYSFAHKSGFPLVVSNAQTYKQFGNAVVPKVIRTIAENIVSVLIEHLHVKNLTNPTPGTITGNNSWMFDIYAYTCD